MAKSSSRDSTNTDAFTWIGSTGGSWGSTKNWEDTTTKQDPATTVPGATNAVTIVGSTGSTYEVITGGGAAASVALTNQVDLAGTYTFGGLTVGSETLVANGYATFATGNLALGDGSTLKLGTLNVLNGQMTVGAGASVTASGAVSLGQPYETGVATGGSTTGTSQAVVGDLTVNGGGSFTASANVSVLDGMLDVDGSGSKLSVGSNLALGSAAVAATSTSKLSSSWSAGNADVTNGGSLAVTGSVTDHGGAIYLDENSSFTAKGALTFDVGEGGYSDPGQDWVGVTDDGLMRVADLTVADPTSSGLSLDVYVDPGSSFEVGTKGNAAAGSITVDAGASITSSAGLDLSASSIVDNGKITESGGALDLDATTSGAGSLALGAHGIIDIGASSSYDYSTDSYVYTPYAVSTAISGFATGDGLILDDVGLTKAVYASTGATTGTLKLYVGSTVEETLLLIGQSYASDTFFISPTTNGGSEVTLIVSGGVSPVSTNTDAFTWIGSTGGLWGSASNWDDTTAKQDPATTVPGAKNAVTIAGSTGLTYEVIVGGAVARAAASVALTNQVDLAGTYRFGGLTVGSETLVANGFATFATGKLALGDGSTLKLGTLNVLDGEMTVGAGASVTASGVVSLGQPYESGVATGGSTTGSSQAVVGDLTVNGGGSFTASGNVSVLDGTLDVDGSGSKLSVGGNLALGSAAVAATATSKPSSNFSQGNVTLTTGGNLAVTGAVTGQSGFIDLYDNTSFTANALTFDVGQGGVGSYAWIAVANDSSMRVADLTVADPTSSGLSLSIDVNFAGSDTSSFEVGSKGNAAAQSITVDAGASLTSTAGLELYAGSIVDNGKITETGGTLDLDAATSGSGLLALGAHGFLDIGASLSYDSSTNSEVYMPYAVSTAISGFATGDGFILDDVALTKAVYDSTGATTGKLQLYVGSTIEETLLLIGPSYASDTFFISPTSNGGSEVTLIGPSSGGVSPVSTNTDAFTWIGSTGGLWGSASNWDDTTAKQDPATTVPGAKNAVTIAGSTGLTYEVIVGGAVARAAASVALTNQVDLAGTYRFGGLTVGSETLVPNGYATFATGNLALGAGATLKLGTLNVLDGEMTVGAGASVTAWGAVSLGQPGESGIATGGTTTGWSYAVSGDLTVNGGGSFTASGNVSVLDGALYVDGSGSKASVGGNLAFGSAAVAATASSKLSSSWSEGDVSLDGGNLAVTGAVTDQSGSIYLYENSSFTAKALTYDAVEGGWPEPGENWITVAGDSSMRVANLTVADPNPTSSDLGLSIGVGSDTSSFEVGSKGNAAAGSITVDAGASITSTAGLELTAGSIVDNGEITESGGTLYLDAATSGSGSLALGAHAIIDIGAPISYGDVYTPYAVSTAISGFATGDGLILDHVGLTKAVYDSTGATTGKLQLYVGSTIEETLLLIGQSYAGDTFFISPTTNGGSEVTLLAPSASHA